MALQPSGLMSIGGPTTGRSINLELGRSATATSSLNESDLRTLAGEPSGEISLSDFYGASLFSASGGIISDYEVSGTLYRAHIFNLPGTFVATGSADITYLIVGGGGGGAGQWGGGGGAGAVKTASTPIGAGSYAVVAGEGGGSGDNPSAKRGISGSNSTLTLPGGTIIAGGGGGGGGGAGSAPNAPVRPGTAGANGSSGGGAGGGMGASSGPGGAGSSPGTAGGSSNNSSPAYGSGGGGGAGGAGTNGSSSSPGTGGIGVQISNFPATSFGDAGYFGGGGAGGITQSGPGTVAGGSGGGGDQAFGFGMNGHPGTGGGGAGGKGPTSQTGGFGGPGTVILRYELSAAAGSTIATGGNISFYGGKTIHTFTNPGSFAAPGSFSKSVEYLAVAGGGGGAGQWGGGGGAGAVIPGTTPLSGPFNHAVTIGVGGNYGFLGNTPHNQGYNGEDTIFGSVITAVGGGGGGGEAVAAKASDTQPNGGSGGGAQRAPGGAPSNGGGSGTYGNPGGGYTGNPRGGGGGGGAGQAGQASPSNAGGAGGYGVQIPATFRNPASANSLGTPGPGGSFYVGGGGGGGRYGPYEHAPGPGGYGGGAEGARFTADGTISGTFYDGAGGNAYKMFDASNSTGAFSQTGTATFTFGGEAIVAHTSLKIRAFKGDAAGANVLVNGTDISSLLSAQSSGGYSTVNVTSTLGGAPITLANVSMVNAGGGSGNIAQIFVDDVELIDGQTKPGKANTGGGGAGGPFSTSTGNGSVGGSGILLIAYDT